MKLVGGRAERKSMRIPNMQRGEKPKKSLKGQARDDLRDDERGETRMGQRQMNEDRIRLPN